MNAKGLLVAGLALCFAGSLGAQALTADQRTKVEAKLETLKAWGTDPAVIDGIKAPAPAWAAAMTQEKWDSLSILGQEVKDLTKNPLGVWLKAHKDPVITEIFVSRADGTKAGFTAKTTNWNHTGKAKHDTPMKGKTWIGEIEKDESTGMRQVQVSFPIIDGGKVIGSVVVGLQVTKL